jgi:uncharacterized membrane protein YhaH (DUF805 family)
MSVSFYRSTKERLLFGLRGRIPRTDFWVGLVVVAVMIALAALLHGHRVRGGSLGAFFGVVAAVAMLSPYCLTALAVKRLHDLDRSGWHALVLLAAFVLGAVAALAYWGLRQGDILPEARSFWTGVLYVTTGLAIAMLASLILKLGFARGSVGDNRFGPDPLAPKALLAIGSEHLSAAVLSEDETKKRSRKPAL